MKNIIIIVSAVLIIGLAWYFTDRRAPIGTTGSLEADSTMNTSASSTSGTSSNSNNLQINTSLIKSMHTVTIQTSKGTIVVETYDQDAPKTVANFISLVNKGYYNGLIFHRVIPGFMIQGGDPTGTGSGGPGYKFADELDTNTPSAKQGYIRGVMAMANAGPNTNGSQFFIMHKDYPLPHKYTIFGKVISGLEVVDAIATTPRDGSDRPTTKVTMDKVTVATSTATI